MASSLVFKFGNQKKGNLVEFPNNISQEGIFRREGLDYSSQYSLIL